MLLLFSSHKNKIKKIVQTICVIFNVECSLFYCCNLCNDQLIFIRVRDQNYQIILVAFGCYVHNICCRGPQGRIVTYLS